jgi:putative endonuclease
MKQGYVYIVSNKNRTVLYIGVTSNLEQRVYQHKNKLLDGFSKKYNCVDLLWWQQSDSIGSAIAREKQLKGWTRRKKESLIKLMNPEFKDLGLGLFGR